MPEEKRSDRNHKIKTGGRGVSGLTFMRRQARLSAV